MALSPALALKGLRFAWNGALGVLYPPSCVGCGAATAEPHALCAACWAGMRLIERAFCERLGTPFALDLGIGPLLSPRAIAEPPVFGRARAVALYEGTARELVHRLKYHDRLDLARAMARMMASAGQDLIADADYLVPCRCTSFGCGGDASTDPRFSRAMSGGSASGSPTCRRLSA